MPRATRDTALLVLRVLVLVLGAVSGVLLEREFASGASGRSEGLSVTHILFGLLLAAVVMPGPILGAVVGPRARPRIRGLAFGGSLYTAFVASLGFAYALRGSRAGLGSMATLGLVFGWCFLAFVLSILDAGRLLRGESPEK